MLDSCDVLLNLMTVEKLAFRNADDLLPLFGNWLILFFEGSLKFSCPG